MTSSETTSSGAASPSGTAAPLYDDPTIFARRWKILAVLCLSLLIVFVGNSSLNVAIPTLARDYDATTSSLQWVIAAYSLVFAGLLFTSGSIGDRFGRKGVLQIGLVGFLVAALMATWSTSMWQFIVCRALMGASAAFIMPSTLSILVNVFPPAERAKAISIWAAVTGGAGALGPVMSGWLLSRFWVGSIFLVNVPFILLALVFGAAMLPKSKDPSHASLDPVGAVLSIVGLSSLVYALIQAPDVGWMSAATLAALGVALAAGIAFVWWERRVEVPMLDMALFRNAAFSTSTAGITLVFVAMYGVMFLVTQYFQLVLGYTPLGSAVRFLPMTPIMILVAPMTPRLVARYGAHRTVGVGLLLVATGLMMFRGLGLDTSYWYVLACVGIMISGMAASMSPLTAALMSAVPPERAGSGSAMNDATRELGAALGVAVLGSIAASKYGSGLDKVPGLDKLPTEAYTAVQDSLGGAVVVAQNIGGAPGKALATVAQESFLGGLHLAVTAGSVLCVVAAVVIWKFLPAHTEPMAGHGPMTEVDALEFTAELGLGGVPVVVPEEDL